MNTSFYIDLSWNYFCVAFGAMLFIRFIMSLQSMNFYTLHVFVRKFSMIDLELPASSLELTTYINGIFKLPPELSKKSLRALKGHLYLDFLFMPLAYGSIFLFCTQISMKLATFGHYMFVVLAWIQIIPWMCDIVENIYLLQKIYPDLKVSKPSIHKAFQIITICKWGIALIAVVSGISTLFYFWLSGIYSYESLHYLLIIIAEVFVIFILELITSKILKVNLDQYRDIGN